MANDSEMLSELLSESMAEWPHFVFASDHPHEWLSWFAEVEPDADLCEWRLDLKRCIAYGPCGQIIVA